MAKYKTAVTAVRPHWSFSSLALSHPYIFPLFCFYMNVAEFLWCQAQGPLDYSHINWFFLGFCAPHNLTKVSSWDFFSFIIHPDIWCTSLFRSWYTSFGWFWFLKAGLSGTVKSQTGVKPAYLLLLTRRTFASLYLKISILVVSLIILSTNGHLSVWTNPQHDASLDG